MVTTTHIVNSDQIQAVING